MPKQKDNSKALAFLQQFVENAGHTVEEPFAAAFRHKPVEEFPDNKMLRAEGVLLFLQTAGRALLTKKCARKECGQLFGTQYKNVAYCSDPCRSKEMEQRWGIIWDNSKDTYRDGLDAERPLVVGPKAYDALIQMAERLLADRDSLLQIQEDPYQSSESLMAEIRSQDNPYLEDSPEQEVHQYPASQHTNLDEQPHPPIAALDWDLPQVNVPDLPL